MTNDMQITAMIPVLSIAAGYIAAFLILLVGNRVRPNAREAITMTAAGLMAVLVCSMAKDVASGIEITCTLWTLAPGLSLEFRVDGAGMLFSCVASVLWILTSIYSIGYMRGHGEQNQTGYFAAFAACLASVLGIAFAANLLTFFIFYELLTISTYPLVVHYRDAKARAAGRKYLGYMLVSGQLFLAAIVIVYVRYGTCTFVPGGFIQAGSMSRGPMAVLFFLMLAGGLVKSAVMPFHGWLPSAMVAPTPVSALLHAVAVVKAGAFCILRVIGYVFGPDSAAWCGGTTALCWLAAITILLSSLIAMRQDNLKARLAYSTIGQLSYIVLGIALLSPYSIAGAMFHIAAHGLLKITLFMCAGAIFIRYHLADISQMGRLYRRMPVTCVCFAAASLGLAGLPLLAGFVSKFALLLGAYDMGKPFFVAVLLAAALLALNYLMPVVQILFGESAADAGIYEPAVEVLAPDGPAPKGAGPKPSTIRGRRVLDGVPALVAPLVVTMAIALILGIWPNAGLHLLDLAQGAALAITGGGFYGG